MSVAFRNEIGVTVLLARGAIADVDILPRARPPLTRLFAGRPVSSLLGVLPRLFSLCSAAHQVAFMSAVEAARAQPVNPEGKQRRVTALVAEWLAELLCGLYGGRLAHDGGSAAAVRALMQAATSLGHGTAESGDRRQAVGRISTALTALGISTEAGQAAAGSALADHIAALGDCAFGPMAAEHCFLSAADDQAVVKRLLADGDAFSDAPDMQGRIPETGVWARQARRGAASPPGSGPAERLKARIAEAARLGAWLEAREVGDEDDAAEDGIVESYAVADRTGAAAVECARGRLYHLVELDQDDRIVRFEFVAPTEWNFHARGPLVRALRGCVLTDNRSGQDAVRAMIGSFDPCVGFSLSFREAHDA